MRSYENPILLTDSYKLSHFKQYPPGTEHVYSYLESRGGRFGYSVFFGLQYILQKYLVGEVVTGDAIHEAAKFAKLHFGNNDNFNYKGWKHIEQKHGGRLPIKIKAVPEGSIIPTKNVLITVENTDPEAYWLTNYIETLLVQTWYPITVATQSWHMREIIRNYLEETGDPAGLPFKLHDFGFRGVSSVETAGIGGAAHLVNFQGTDTLAGIYMLQMYYHAGMPGFSIPASEHSTITSWGKEHEVDAMRNMLTQYPTGLVACVSDSFDIYKACNDLWGDQLRYNVLNRDGALVIRPDSGEPTKVIPKVLEILGKQFGESENVKGYRVLNPKVRVIQGDGIDFDTMPAILDAMKQEGWSADNIAFGSGGGLLQKLNRDTMKFAFKCSNVTVNGEEREVFKSPITDSFKVSKKGRLKLVKVGGSVYTTVNQHEDGEDELRTVFKNGEIVGDEQDLETIRKRVNDMTAGPRSLGYDFAGKE